ncbi:hypothetical protein BGY98DRAFT_168578 [Russula aff. rugulosa BPL654]|nr:hypothetical protein BGY98DRAFT_168578 [Russula aff. rugulosa BPL654]
MEILLERRASWRALRPSRRTSVALAGHCHAYELVGGLFAKALDDLGAARRLVASWLPGNGRVERRFVVDDLGVRVKDFALDPSQDLIVLLEHRPAPGRSSMAGADICVHLRKLSAVVAPHPAAKTPMLCRRAIGPVHGCMIQVVEDIVGMYFWMPFHAVLIWNWMSGEELLFIQENQAPERIWDFSFLSSRAYMVTTLKDGGEIHIYSLMIPPQTNSRRMSRRCTSLHPTMIASGAYHDDGPIPSPSTPGRTVASAHNARVHVFTLHTTQRRTGKDGNQHAS